jgi:protocatechuate 3,4-dioxygenase beta subunit
MKRLLAVVLLAVAGSVISVSVSTEPGDAQASTGLVAAVSADGAQSVEGVTVDLFRSDDVGNRLGYLRSAPTGGDGTYRFELIDSGCFSLVFIAPAGSTFATGQYSQHFRCVEDGTTERVEATLSPSDDAAAFITTVTGPDGEPVAGVDVAMFDAGADGSQGAFRRSAQTGPEGIVSFFDADGCVVLVATAPAGSTFVNGSTVERLQGCAEPGAELRFAVEIGGGGASAVYQGAVVDTSGVGVAGTTVEVWRATETGSRSTFLFAWEATDSGSYRFELNPGCYVTVTLTPLDREYEGLGNYYPQFLCLEAGQTFTAETPPVVALTGPAYITGTVDRPPDGFSIEVAVYRSDADGNQGERIDSLFMPGDVVGGVRYRFELEPGCYLVELVAADSTKLTSGNQSERFSDCLDGGIELEIPEFGLLPASAINLDFETVTGVAYLPGNDRILVTGDNKVEIRSADGTVVHTLDRLPQVTLPTPVQSTGDDSRAVVYAEGSNQLVVINTDDGSIVRRIDPGAANLSSIDIVGDVIWYHHGPDQWDAGVGRALLSGGDGQPNFYDGDYAGSVVQVSPAQPQRAYVVARTLSPRNLEWHGPDGAYQRNPYHASFWPFSVTDDGEVWAVNNGSISQIDPDDLTRTGRAISLPEGHRTGLGLLADDSRIHLATGGYIRSYDRSTLESVDQTPTYLDLRLRHFDVAGGRRVATLSSAGNSLDDGDWYLTVD